MLFGSGDLNWETEKHKHDQEQNQEEDKLHKLFYDFFIASSLPLEATLFLLNLVFHFDK